MSKSRLKIKVVPGARQSNLAGWLGDELKIRISAPPEKGKANSALIELLASKLGLPISKLKIVQGQMSQRKTVEIEGYTEAGLRHRINQQLDVGTC